MTELSPMDRAVVLDVLRKMEMRLGSIEREMESVHDQLVVELPADEFLLWMKREASQQYTIDEDEADAA